MGGAGSTGHSVLYVQTAAFENLEVVLLNSTFCSLNIFEIDVAESIPLVSLV